MSVSYFISAFLGLTSSFTLALLIAGIFKYLGRKDRDVQKKRAAHSRPTSRLGGIAVCLSILAVIILNNEAWNLEVAISALPIFAAGLMEDLGLPLKSKIHLAVGALSAGIFVFLKRQYINDVGIEWVNLLLSVTPIAIAFTVFCVVALINALNFIDGINGLASGKTFIASFALMWLADVGHSIFRRRMSKMRSDRPDYLHLHHVIMRSLVIVSDGSISKQLANPLATAIILPMAAVPVLLGVVFHQNNGLCIGLFFGFALLFACMHYSIIKAVGRRVFVLRRPKKNSFTEIK